jgi:hypothetical protein
VTSTWSLPPAVMAIVGVAKKLAAVPAGSPNPATAWTTQFTTQRDLHRGALGAVLSDQHAKRTWIALAVGLVALAIPTPASGATTIGQTSDPGIASCGENSTSLLVAALALPLAPQ